MKILNVSSLYPPNVVGGAELGLRTMSEAMVDAGHDVHVITLQAPGNSGKPVTDTRGPVTVTSLPLANIYWPFATSTAQPNAAKRLLWHSIDTANSVMAKRVEQLVRRIRPDVVLTRNLQGFSTAVMPAIRRAGVPLVHVLHDYSLLCPRTTMFRAGQACGMRSQRCTGCRVLTAPRRPHTDAADAVIGVSQAVLDQHLAHGLFTGKPNRVIYNALKPEIQIRERIAQRNADQPFTFGFLGRIEASKGIETLLRAAATLDANGRTFRLLIAGRGEQAYLDELQRRWPLRQVEYVGFVNAAVFLRQLDTLVFPSLWAEALGNGVFEAFAQGVPVIGSQAGGIPESIDDGKTGFIFQPDEHEQLANFMQRLQADDDARNRMGRAALRKAREYLPQNRVPQYVEFLDQVLQRAKPVHTAA